MPADHPVLLLVSTQTWLQLTRMALRLVRYGASVHALCPEGHELRFFRGLEGFYTLDPADSLHSLVHAVETSGADYLVPGDDQAVWLMHKLGKLSPRFQELVERSLGPAHGYKTLESRATLLSLAQQLGIAVPETVSAPTAKEARQWVEGRKLPIVLKKDGTFGGEGVAVIDELDEIELFYARLSGSAPTSEICAQGFVEGVAANAMFACQKGEILGGVQARVLAAKGKTGPSLVFRLIQDERISRAGELLARHLELSGFFGLDFIIDAESGAPLLIELNPRCTQLGHIQLPNQADLIACMWEGWGGAKPKSSGEKVTSDTVYFHPAAREWATDSRLLAHARPDVCREDLRTIDSLAASHPMLPPRLSLHLRRALITLRNAVIPPEPPPIHYFDVSWPGEPTSGQERHENTAVRTPMLSFLTDHPQQSGRESTRKA